MASIRILLAVLAMVWTGWVAADAAETVNINTADAETIARVLNGVGLKKAEAIVQHRETHGRFDNAADLIAVKGIGESTVKKNADKIVVSEMPAEKPKASTAE